MISPQQIRAARSLAGLTQAALAKAAAISATALNNIEKGGADPKVSTLERIRVALEAAGVEFTNGDQPGVRLSDKAQKSDSQMDNDDLGKWGERWFATMCSAAGMIANKAEHDKMGWDFVVELPPDPSERPLDHQRNRLSCRIQVKTQWLRRDLRFDMSLSAGQRLATDPGPSFVLVLVAKRPEDGRDPTVAECYLIHLIDNNLERTLKRLREADAATKTRPLGEQIISFDPKIAGVPVEPTGAGLRGALLGKCGKGPDDYFARKSEQLRNLGYETGRYRLETTVVAKNIDEFVEMMLGLRPATIEKFATYDTRFGISRPIDHLPGSGTLQAKIEPGALKCTIRVRGEGLTPPAVFQAEVVFPAVRDFPAEHRRILIRARFFTLDWHANGTIDFRLEGPLHDVQLKLEEWRQHLRLLELLSQTSVKFEVEGEGQGLPRSAVSLTLTTPRELDSWVVPMMEVIRRSQALLSMAGIDGKPITLDKLGESASLVSQAYHCLVDPQDAPLQSFESTNPVPGANLGDTQFLQAGYVIIAGTLLAYSCRTTMRPQSSGDSLVWRQVDLKPEKVLVIDNLDDAYREFVAEEQRRTGLQSSIVQTLGTPGALTEV